jgi:hypothetical protein
MEPNLEEQQKQRQNTAFEKCEEGWLDFFLWSINSISVLQNFLKSFFTLYASIIYEANTAPQWCEGKNTQLNYPNRASHDFDSASTL